MRPSKVTLLVCIALLLFTMVLASCGSMERFPSSYHHYPMQGDAKW